MVISPMLRHLFNDDKSLSSYLEGKLVSFDDLKRRIFLKERSENRSIPDQHYALMLQKNFDGLETLGGVLGPGLCKLSKDYLELKGSRIHVQQQKQNEWQQLITYMPPLILQAAFLHIEKPLTSTISGEVLEYFKNYILPNAKYTALPYPYIPQLESYIRDKKGLHDLHMHLNGATETDIAWQDFLASPDKVHNELYDGFKMKKVREQLEQESHLLDPLKFYNLLLIARRIRYIFFDFVFAINEDTYKGFKQLDLLLKITDVTKGKDFSSSYFHPFQYVISREDEYPYQMAVEGLMYVLLFQYLEKRPESMVTNLFHFYLLILGLANRLLVQQTHQYGFEQFQKHTLNGLREFSEKDYLRRFFQMHGNELRNIFFLEGRFSPKDTDKKNVDLLEAIEKGWKKLVQDIGAVIMREDPEQTTIPLPTLKLIAHFIKRGDDKPDPDIRHKFLRIDTWKRAQLLSALLKNGPDSRERIVGIDAAASEFDAPPEVFAPVFRMMRRSGMKHFTYHAGEDFHHIISGLRAIYEAVTFSDMQRGDRIGHATATGISVEQWIGAMGKDILIKKGEWLDDLIFSYHIIVSEKIDALKFHLPNIINEIEKLAHGIYGKSFMVKELEDAWLLRRFCPILLFTRERADARRQEVYDDDEWCEINRKKIKRNCKELLMLYHNFEYRKKYDEPISINAQGFLGDIGLRALQLVTLRILHRKEIVIETLPTSNVRIGHYRDFNTYHLWNWFNWEDEEHPIPPIVVGSDDTGIFATSIYNEYANIYCHLTGSGKMTHNKAMNMIERLEVV